MRSGRATPQRPQGLPGADLWGRWSGGPGEGPAGELHLAFQFVPSQKPPLQPTWIGSTIRNPRGSWQQQLEIQPTLMMTSFATAVSRCPGTYNVVTARGTAPVEFVRRPTDGAVE